MINFAGKSRDYWEEVEQIYFLEEVKEHSLVAQREPGVQLQFRNVRSFRAPKGGGETPSEDLCLSDMG